MRVGWERRVVVGFMSIRCVKYRGVGTRWVIPKLFHEPRRAESDSVRIIPSQRSCLRSANRLSLVYRDVLMNNYYYYVLSS